MSYWLDGGENGFNPWQKQEVPLFSTASTTTPGPNYRPTERLSAASFPTRVFLFFLFLVVR
jgi:hypothetical protein